MYASGTNCNPCVLRIKQHLVCIVVKAGVTGIIIMFTMKLKRVDDRMARQIWRICADTLAEAERYIISALQVQYDSRSIVMIHKGDLVYHVYDHSGFLGIVEIRLEG